MQPQSDYITTHGSIFKERMTLAEQQLYEVGKVVVRANVKEGHRVYVAFQPAGFMRKLFAGNCEVLEHLEGKKEDWGLAQDEWVVRKL